MESGAELPRLKTTLNSVPGLSVVHSLLQPVRVIAEPILLIPSVGQRFACAFVGDNEGKDGEGEDENDEQEHDQQVDPEKPSDAAARADEPSQRHQQKEDAEHDHRLLEPSLAVGIGLPAEPNAGDQNGDREE